MLWLFGQIWVWLLIAFALGALSAALVLGRRRSPSLDRISPVSAASSASETSGGGVQQASEQAASAQDPANSPVRARTRPAAPRRTEHTLVTGDLSAGSEPNPTEITMRQAAVREDYPPPPPAEPSTPDTERQQRHAYPAEEGHRSGTLPSRRAWHTRNEWPDEADEAASEQHIPRPGG